MALPPHDPDEVRRIAALARIRLRPEEAVALSADFGRILALVGRLKDRTEADGVEPLLQSVPPGEPVASLREDEPRPPEKPDAPLSRDEVLRLAPERTNEYVQVPRVLAGGR